MYKEFHVATVSELTERACTISTKRKYPKSIQVMLLTIPSLPNFEAPPHPRLEHQAVVAASDANEEYFGYVHLSSDYKELIARAMMDAGCDRDRWYWCNVRVLATNTTEGIETLQEAIKRHIDDIKENRYE